MRLLNRFTGGSAVFGGPQDANGYIHLNGNFLMSKNAANRVNYINFQVPSTSYVRLFLSPDTGTDLYLVFS